MSYRPKGVDDGSRAAPPIPTTATVFASYGDNPDRVASSVHLSFAPTAGGGAALSRARARTYEGATMGICRDSLGVLHCSAMVESAAARGGRGF
jgi:hypothetical protein